MQEFVHFQDLLARKLTEYRDVLKDFDPRIGRAMPINLIGIPG